LTLGVRQFTFHECRRLLGLLDLRKSLVNCDVNFGLPGYWIQDTGLLSVSGLGAVSAESCGRDSFVESAGFGQLRFGLSAAADDHQLSEFVEGLWSPPGLFCV